jgi:ATP phosphoribosyltransferase regulatory subunit
LLHVDLGEVRGFAYYTGMIFHVLADGPGEPIGAGGRYDDLLARFDAPMPATGFALYLDSVAWAREAAGLVDRERARVVVARGVGSSALTAALRDRGVAAVEHEAEGALPYARAWRWSHVARITDEGATLTAVDAASPALRLPASDAASIAAAIASAVT